MDHRLLLWARVMNWDDYRPIAGDKFLGISYEDTFQTPLVTFVLKITSNGTPQTLEFESALTFSAAVRKNPYRHPLCKAMQISIFILRQDVSPQFPMLSLRRFQLAIADLGSFRGNNGGQWHTSTRRLRARRREACPCGKSMELVETLVPSESSNRGHVKEEEEKKKKPCTRQNGETPKRSHSAQNCI